LPSDTLAHERPLAYDGGPEGTALLRRAVTVAAEHLAPGGAVLLELGGDQDVALRAALDVAGFTEISVGVDDDGELRSIEARRPARS
jgi:release factor glutamine methyltransferase